MIGDIDVVHILSCTSVIHTHVRSAYYLPGNAEAHLLLHHQTLNTQDDQSSV